MGAVAQWLQKRGLKPGLVTNDQGEGLVDTEMGRDFTNVAGSRPAVRQVTGGCFCCQVDSLVEALGRLADESKPDVFVVEPVGSCTDLMATVMLPLRRVYGSDFELSPMSVVVDATRATGVFGGGSTSQVGRVRDSGEKTGAGRIAGKRDFKDGFSKEVNYIYRKQLEEAEILVVNKVDLLKAGERKALRNRLGKEYPDKRILEVSARKGEGLEAWFEVLMRETSQPKAIMEVDYDVYAEGEALLGWYNAALSVHAVGDGFDGNKVVRGLARAIQRSLEGEGAELAHFKMSLRASFHAGENGETRRASGEGSLAVVNAVGNGAKAELSSRMGGPVMVGELLVNLRAEGDPKLLATVVERELKKPRKDARLVWQEQAAFRPGRPEPTHRITSLDE